MIPKNIKDSVVNTMGYKESEDKQSFNIGSQVAFRQSEEYYDQIVAALESQVEMWKSAYERTFADIKILTSIISKYTDND